MREGGVRQIVQEARSCRPIRKLGMFRTRLKVRRGLYCRAAVCEYAQRYSDITVTRVLLQTKIKIRRRKEFSIMKLIKRHSVSGLNCAL